MEPMTKNAQTGRLSDAILDNMPIAIAVYEVLNGGGRGSDYIVRFLNRAALRLEGKALAEVLGKKLSDLRPQADSCGFIPELKKVWETGGPGVCRVLVPGGGAVRCYENNIFRLQSGEVAAMYTDITSRKNTEAELVRARTELEGSLRAKSAFLANMSHELRTPLNSIIGFCEVLEDGTFGPLTEKQKKYVQNILGSGRGLLALINDILSLSRIDSGEAGFEPEKLRLADLLADCLALFREKAMRHKIDLSLDTAALDGAGEVEADKLKLKQVLANLLSNALKFTPAGGRVAVKAAAAPGGFYEISVSDTGTGIKAGNMEYLFSPFCSLEPVYTKNYSGAGIGLALAKKLVEMHGGAIRAESAEGKGSSFIFTIPVKRG